MIKPVCADQVAGPYVLYPQSRPGPVYVLGRYCLASHCWLRICYSVYLPRILPRPLVPPLLSPPGLVETTCALLARTACAFSSPSLLVALAPRLAPFPTAKLRWNAAAPALPDTLQNLSATNL